MAQRYSEETNVGDEIGPLVKLATTQVLVKWAGASGDFNPLHYDDHFAAAQGGKIVHGALKRQWLLQLVSDFAGEAGMLRRFSCRYRASDIPRLMKTLTDPEDGETWLCKGKVTKKCEQDGARLADCELWVENGKGEATTSGKATVELPSR